MKRGKMHPWWHGNPPKKTDTAKPELKRGKQTIQGEHGPIGVYKSKGGK